MKRTALVFALHLSLAAGLCGCQSGLPLTLGQMAGIKMSDEEKIALILDDIERGIEGRRVYQVLAHVSRNYYDKDKRNYAALQRDLNELIKNYRDIRITRTPPRIQVQGNRARVVDAFGTIAESNDPIAFPPMNLQGQVVIIMERYGDAWQIVEWGPIS